MSTGALSWRIARADGGRYAVWTVQLMASDTRNKPYTLNPLLLSSQENPHPHRPRTSLPQSAPIYWTDVAASRESTPSLFSHPGIQRRHRYPALTFTFLLLPLLFLSSHWH